MKHTVYAIILLVLGFSACSTLEEVSPQDSKVLTFENEEDFQNYLNQSLAANYKELVALEATKDFNSFGKTADEWYQKAANMDFKSRAEIEAFVEQHSDYLQLVTEESGEVSLETRIYNSPLRYLVNNDRIYQTGKTAVKVFENGYVSTSATNMEALQDLKGFTYQQTENDEMAFFPRTSTSQLLSRTTGSCGEEAEDISTSGGERIRLELTSSYHQYEGVLGYAGPNFTDPIQEYAPRAHYKVRSQSRFLGIWFAAQRVISGEINVKTRLISPAGTWAYVRSASNSGDYDSRWEGTLYGGRVALAASDAGTDNLSVCYDAYHAWAQTPSVPFALLSCNKADACVNGCTDPANPCEGVTCLPGYECVNGTCRVIPVFCSPACPPGYTCFGGNCVQNNE